MKRKVKAVFHRNEKWTLTYIILQAVIYVDVLLHICQIIVIYFAQYICFLYYNGSVSFLEKLDV